MSTNALIPIERIEQQIFLIRGQKVMLDSHLALLYCVPTKQLNDPLVVKLKGFGNYLSCSVR
jgi:hypothetical protein